MTAGFVHTAVKLSLSVMQDMAGGILSQDVAFSRQQTLSLPVWIGTQLPQMHLNFEFKIV